MVDYNAQSLDKHIASTLALGKATGNEDRAQVCFWPTSTRSSFGDIQRRVEGKPRPKVYVELGYGGPGVIGNTYNNAMWGRMVESFCWRCQHRIRPYPDRLGTDVGRICAGRCAGAYFHHRFLVDQRAECRARRL